MGIRARPNRDLERTVNINGLRWNMATLAHIFEAVSRVADELACWQHAACWHCRMHLGRWEPLWPGMIDCCAGCERKLRAHWLPDRGAYYCKLVPGALILAMGLTSLPICNGGYEVGSPLSALGKVVSLRLGVEEHRELARRPRP